MDEATALTPATERGRARVRAEADWQAFAAETGLKLHIFRLAGIYGPGRGPFEKVRQGTARQIVKPGQVFSRIHAEDCAECETATGMIDRIERDITLIGPLDADQRAKLLAIADRCPVHRTLRSEVSIHTAEARADEDKG